MEILSVSAMRKKRKRVSAKPKKAAVEKFISLFDASDAEKRPDHPRAAPAGRHRAGIRIGEGDLLIGRSKHHFLNRFKALHLFFELDQLLLEPRGPGHKLFRRHLTGSCLAIGRVKSAQIARNALLDLRKAPLHLSLGEVVVTR